VMGFRKLFERGGDFPWKIDKLIMVLDGDVFGRYLGLVST
jgi:hypothetical protein